MQERLKIIHEQDSSSDDEEDLVVKARDPSENWDCQTILSTYSNIYNHPKLISEKKVKYFYNLPTILNRFS